MPDADPAKVLFTFATMDTFDADTIEFLWDAGVRDPDFAFTAHRMDLSRYDIVTYLAANVTTGADLDAHEQAAIGPALAYALHQAGHTSPETQRAHREDHPDAYLDNWWESGILDPAAVDTLTARGVNSGYAYVCTRAGYRTPDDIAALHEAGVSSASITFYRDNGVDTAAEAIRLWHAGVEAKTAAVAREPRNLGPDATLTDIETWAARQGWNR